MKDIVKRLTELNKQIATMESCTGGAVASAITNIEGASEVIRFSLVTYSNEYKIKMGVKKETIDKYSVYSPEVAREMAFNASVLANSNYGVGVTGKLNRVDKRNLSGEDNITYVSIYDRDNNVYYDFTVCATKSSRVLNKDLIIDRIRDKLINIIS